MEGGGVTHERGRRSSSQKQKKRQSIASSGESKEEKLLQRDPRAFLDDVYNATFKYLAEGLDELEKTISEGIKSKKAKATGAALADVTLDADLKRRVGEGVDELYQQFQTGLSSHIESFESLFLESVVHVPEHLKFESSNSSSEADAESHASSDMQFLTAEEKRLDSEIAAFRRQVAAAQYVRDRLSAECGSLDQQSQSYTELVHKVSGGGGGGGAGRAGAGAAGASASSSAGAGAGAGTGPASSSSSTPFDQAAAFAQKVPGVMQRMQVYLQEVAGVREAVSRHPVLGSTSQPSSSSTTPGVPATSTS